MGRGDKSILGNAIHWLRSWTAYVEEGNWAAARIYHCPLTSDLVWPDASMSCSLDFPSIINILKSELKWTLFWVAFIGRLITAKKKITHHIWPWKALSRIRHPLPFLKCLVLIFFWLLLMGITAIFFVSPLSWQFVFDPLCDQCTSFQLKLTITFSTMSCNIFPTSSLLFVEWPLSEEQVLGSRKYRLKNVPYFSQFYLIDLHLKLLGFVSFYSNPSWAHFLNGLISTFLHKRNTSDIVLPQLWLCYMPVICVSSMLYGE